MMLFTWMARVQCLSGENYLWVLWYFVVVVLCVLNMHKQPSIQPSKKVQIRWPTHIFGWVNSTNWSFGTTRTLTIDLCDILERPSKRFSNSSRIIGRDRRPIHISHLWHFRTGYTPTWHWFSKNRSLCFRKKDLRFSLCPM